MRRIGVHTRAPGGTPQDAGGAVARLARWVVAHRGRIAIGWIALLVLAMGVARAAQPHYINNLSLPGTDSQRATDVLVHSFRAQSGDTDQIVLHTISGRITDADVRARVTPVLTRLAHLAHVTGVVSPYTPAGARAVSTDGRTAFATITFDDRPDALPKAAVDR